jgi:nitrogen fixation protein FixH
MNPTRNLWPLGIIAAFVIFISGTVGLIVMASSQKTDLISPNYYEQEIKYQGRIDSLARTEQLGSRAKIAFDAQHRRITISVPAEHVRSGLAGKIQLYRPSAPGLDRQFTLEPDSQGMQFIDAATLPRGFWKVRVSWTVEGREFFIDQPLVIGQ